MSTPGAPWRPSKRRGGLQLSDHFRGIHRCQWWYAVDRVAEQLAGNAVQTERDDRPERGILATGDDQRHAGWRHGLNHRPGNRQAVIVGKADLGYQLPQILPRLGHLCGVVDVAVHAGEVRSTAYGAAGGLQHDIPAQLISSRDCLGQAGDGELPHQVDPVGTQ